MKQGIINEVLTVQKNTIDVVLEPNNYDIFITN